MSQDTLRFAILEDPEAFRDLEPAWGRLSDELAGEVTVFASVTWYQNWWRFFGAGAELFLFAMWQGEDLVGVAPLMSQKSTIHFLPVKTVGFIQNNQSLHNDFIIRPQFRKYFIQSLLQTLFERSHQWDVILFRNFPAVSENHDTLIDILKADGRQWRQQLNVINSPFLHPTGNWQDFLARRARKTKKNLNNIRNKIRLKGNVIVINIRTYEEFLACREEIFQVARQSWSEEGGDSLGSPANRDFYDSLAFSAAAKGWLSIWALYLDDRMIAVEFHLKAFGREHALRGHYLPDFASLSPGTYLEMSILEKIFAEEERVRVYDFGGAFDSYKKKWTDAFVPHCDLYLFKDQLYSQYALFHEFVLVPAARRIVSILKQIPQRPVRS